MMRLVRPHVICAIFLVSSSPVMRLYPAAAQHVEEPSQEAKLEADALIKEAVEHYSAHRFGAAVLCFKQAYTLVREPELLFNIARSYEKDGRKESAVEGYETFLGAPGTTAELRKAALLAMDGLRKQIEAERIEQEAKKPRESPRKETPQPAAGNGATAPANAAASTIVEPATAPVTAPASAVTGPKASPSSGKAGTRRRPLKISSYVLMGTGAAAWVVGAVFGGLLLGVNDDFQSAGFEPKRVQYRDTMRRYALTCDITFIGGGALVAAGGALFIVDAVKHKSEREKAAAIGRREHQDEGGNVTVTPILSIAAGGLTGGFIGNF